MKGMGLTDEQVDTIIEAHTDTVDGLKADVSRYKADAEKLPGVQKQLDNLKAAGDGGYQEKYEKEHKAFEDFKANVTAKESKAAKEKAVRAYFESKHITGANLDLAMRGCGEEMAALELTARRSRTPRALMHSWTAPTRGLSPPRRQRARIPPIPRRTPAAQRPARTSIRRTIRAAM